MSSPPQYDVLTLHPELVRGPLTGSILGRAMARQVIGIGIHDIRDHARDRHRSVDDAPYGGGAGMVMRVDVVADALAAVVTPASRVILTSPAGRPFTQAVAADLATCEHLVLICGHYEGIDARIESLCTDQISLGDFVLTGGEIAAVAVVDAVARLVPGVLGNEASALEESFSTGLLEHPQYTRPRVWHGVEVPEVLLSGHHARVADWRLAQARRRTRERRSDLWEQYLHRHLVDDSGSKD